MILLGEEFSGEAPLLGDEVWQPVDGHLLDRLRSGPVELAVDENHLVRASSEGLIAARSSVGGGVFTFL